MYDKFRFTSEIVKSYLKATDALTNMLKNKRPIFLKSVRIYSPLVI